MAAAVAGWSPVITTGTIPAMRAAATAGSAEGRSGSASAIRPSTRRPLSSSPALSRVDAATASTRCPSAAYRSAAARMAASRPAGSSTTAGSSTDSGAPLHTTSTGPDGVRCAVVIRARTESKGSSATRGWAARTEAGSSPARAAAASRAASSGSPPAPQPAPSSVGGSKLRVVAQHPGHAAGRPAVPAAVHHRPWRTVARGVVARAGDDRLRRRSPQPLYGHRALGQGAGLVRGDHGDRAQGLHGRQAPDQRSPGRPSAGRRAPGDSDTTAGSDSGTAATTRLTAVTTICSSGSPAEQPEPCRPAAE